MLEYMAPRDVEKQFALRHMIINFLRPSYWVFWTLVRRELRTVNAQKRFWGYKIMEALGSLSPTLRTVDRVGVVDEQWMVAVADFLNVRVRFREKAVDERHGISWLGYHISTCQNCRYFLLL